MDYRATLNLPQTKFKMKANLAQKEPEFLRRWDKEDLYGTIQSATADRPPYILHDGPPYANGHIHLGTAFNKVLKDIILKSKRMAGYHCPYVPGWDCHGLPIEHNVDKELGPKKKEMSKLAVRGACRKYAEKWIKTQKQEFVRLGVLGDWSNPYLTINFKYEAAIAREFNRFLLSGGVVKSKKPVYWCSTCHTALAEAEVEYYDHASPSIYVKFPLIDSIGDLVGEEAAEKIGAKKVYALIWTTTPWTLPANLAVALHPDYPYVAVEVEGEVWILAEALVEQVMADLGKSDYSIIASLSATGLEGRKCMHPFMERESLLILAPYVTLDAGTGCVHTAPGHGREDYQSGLNYNLPILSPVDSDGRFTDEAGPYSGMFILDANPVINADMAKQGSLAGEDDITHSYPHCWRCKKPVIFRATEQWFISMAENDLRDKALAAIRQVDWTPKWGMERIYGMVDSRPDWCLSRQRAWGVPLTVLLCKKCGEPLKDKEVAERIVTLFEKEGADAWFRYDVAEFIGNDTCCGHCGAKDFTKEEDILDVWFDSGVSYAAVLEERQELHAPADLYLEGSDQHRGWFQSSLLAAVGTRDQAPYRGVLTHGFVVDGQGKKMSKSIGNVIAPDEVIKKYGAEILRLWVASEDYRDDIKISDGILRQLSDAYRKMRNTIRYLLGNLSDFNVNRDRVAYSDLEELDRWALLQLELLKSKAVKAYDAFEFHTVFHGLYTFCGVTMSAFYLDIIKDRLYTAPPDSVQRRGAQTVLYDIVDTMLRLMAPIMSFTATEAWAHLPQDDKRPDQVFLALFPEENSVALDSELDSKWKQLLAVRGEITKALELARQNKIIGHPLEAEVRVAVGAELETFLKDKWEMLQVIAIVSELVPVKENGIVADGESEIYVSSELSGLQIAVRPASGGKCERCWLRDQSVGNDADHPELCSRCTRVVAELA
jgi:isoleucyl-tRNA synthetase